MFFASVNKPGGENVEMFSYFLADRLGKTLAELDAMPHAEYVGWVSFHRVKNQATELAAKARK